MGRMCFSPAAIDEIRALLRQIRTAERNRQKTLRSRLRRLGFYISDFTDDNAGFTASDLDVLIRRGTVTVDEDCHAT